MLATTSTMKDENSAPTTDGELANGERKELRFLRKYSVSCRSGFRVDLQSLSQNWRVQI